MLPLYFCWNESIPVSSGWIFCWCLLCIAETVLTMFLDFVCSPRFIEQISFTSQFLPLCLSPFIFGFCRETGWLHNVVLFQIEQNQTSVKSVLCFDHYNLTIQFVRFCFSKSFHQYERLHREGANLCNAGEMLSTSSFFKKSRLSFSHK